MAKRFRRGCIHQRFWDNFSCCNMMTRYNCSYVLQRRCECTRGIWLAIIAYYCSFCKELNRRIATCNSCQWLSVHVTTVSLWGIDSIVCRAIETRYNRCSTNKYCRICNTLYHSLLLQTMRCIQLHYKSSSNKYSYQLTVWASYFIAN